jgi:hypothetical protein
MKDIYRTGNHPDSSCEFISQSSPSTPPKKDQKPVTQEKPKPKVPAQRPVLGKKMWNPNAPTTYPN